MAIQIAESCLDFNFSGKLLIHEHIFCRFRPECYKTVENYLQGQFLHLERQGVSAIVDPTAYTTPETVCRMDIHTSIKVGFSVGYYTESYVSSSIKAKQSDELMRMLSKKIYRGVGSKQRIPVMLKCGSGGSRPSKIEEKLLFAVSSVQNQTGLPLQVHSCDGAEEQYEVLRSAKAADEKLMFCHLEMGMKTGRRLAFDQILDRCKRVLDRGSFVFFNDFGVSQTIYRDMVIKLVSTLVDSRFSSQLCVGTDSNYSVRRGRLLVRGSNVGSNSARTYGYIFDHTRNLLVKSGIDKSAVDMMCFHNAKKFVSGKSQYEKFVTS